MVGEQWDYLSNVISTIVVEKLVRKRCETYLAYVWDASVTSLTVESIQTVKNFQDIFLEELPMLPSDCEIELRIDLFSRMTLVFIAPYRMALKELKELKVQLLKLLDHGFKRPNVSP